MSDPVPSSAISDATTGGLSVIVITGGSTGQVLTLQSNGTYAPATVSAGDVVGPSSSTDNAVARFDATTGKILQNSGVTIDDSANLTTSGSVATGGTNNGVRCGGLSVGYSLPLLAQIAGGQINVYESGSSRIALVDSQGIRIGSALGLWVSSTTASSGTIDAKLIRAGTGQWSTCSDNGIAVKNLAGSADAALTAAAITASGLMCCGVYTFSTVPSASSNTGKFLRISDRAQKHAYSDGTNWRFFGDDAVIS